MTTGRNTNIWISDLLKQIIAYSIGILVFALTLDRCQHRWEVEHDITVKIVDEYQEASLRYLLNSYDAIEDAKRSGRSRKSSDFIKNWQDNDFDRLKIAEAKINTWIVIKKDHIPTWNKTKDSLSTLRTKLKNELDSGVSQYRLLKAQGKLDTTWTLFRKYYKDTLRQLYLRLDSVLISTCKYSLYND